MLRRIFVGLAIVVCLAPRVGHTIPAVSAGSDIVNVGDVFTIPISYTSLPTDPDLISWQFDLSFDPAVLQANVVTEGPFMSSFGTTFFTPGVIDNSSGLISLVAASYVDLPPNPSGSGVLANIEFQALAPGLSPLDLSNVFLTWDDQGFPPSFLVVDGLVCVLNGVVCVAQPPGNGIPEPGTLVLLLGALAAWSYLPRRRHRPSSARGPGPSPAMTFKQSQPSRCASAAAAWLRHSALVLIMAAFGQSVSQADVRDRVRPAWVVSLVGDRLTVHLDKAPLRLVLAELARQGGFRVQLREQLDTPVVSGHFERLPLDQAVERLLSGWSYAVIYDAASSVEQGRSVQRITELLVLDQAGPPNEGLRDSHAPDSTVVLANPGPQERIQTLETWMTARNGSSGVDPLTHAMVDPDEQVRARAQDLLEGFWSGSTR